MNIWAVHVMILQFEPDTIVSVFQIVDNIDD